MSEQKLEEARRLRKQGATIEVIAATTGLTEIAVKGATVSKATIWSEGEQIVLRHMAGKASASDIAKLVNKTKRQVQHKAQRLGLSLAFLNRKPKPWSVSDERFLRKNAGVVSGVSIAKHLERPVEHVYRKAQLMGLSLHVYGECSHAAIYSNEDIELCRKLSDAGLKAPTIAKKMEMSRSFVHQVINHERRAYL
ncbi:hypothetical protein [Vibrio rotiferianus]|uniref:hypothetical protein n=1 Tax=Vibrio rotiferianus TaxID=190895 RepID=UPI001110CE25|nr:hypothetical protein [Vibrio rotiferianus]TMX64582.1 hypothetical protein DA097_12715 [Vibrio rotiferianus]